MDISLKQEYGKKETHLFLPFSDLFRMPIVSLDSIRKKEEEDDKRNNQYYTGGVNSQGGGRLYILWFWHVADCLSLEEMTASLCWMSCWVSRPPNSVLIKLYKNGYIENGNEFCKCDDTEEHKRIYETLIEGYSSSSLFESDMFPKSTRNLFVLKGLRFLWMIIVERRISRLHLALVTRVIRSEVLSLLLGLLWRSSSAEEIRASPGTFNNYPKKETTPIRVNLAVGRSITLNVTEDWNCEDLYSAVAEQTPDISFELMTAFPPKKIPCTPEKVLKLGLGKTVIRQVKHWRVCWDIVFFTNGG